MSGPMGEGPFLVIPAGTAACLECGCRWTEADAEEQAVQHHRRTKHVTTFKTADDSPGTSPTPG